MLTAEIARTQRTKHLEAVNSSGVAIRKCKMHRVIPYESGLEPFQILRNALRIESSASGHFVSARRARTMLSQITERKKTDVSVLPRDSKLFLSDLF